MWKSFCSPSWVTIKEVSLLLLLLEFLPYLLIIFSKINIKLPFFLDYLKFNFLALNWLWHCLLYFLCTCLLPRASYPVWHSYSLHLYLASNLRILYRCFFTESLSSGTLLSVSITKCKCKMCKQKPGLWEWEWSKNAVCKTK